MSPDKQSPSTADGPASKVRQAVAAIVWADGRVLLVHKFRRENVAPGPADEWDIPKGGIHGGESTDDALKRELWEELGTTNYSFSRLAAKISFKFPPGSAYTEQETTVYKVLLKTGENKLTPGGDIDCIEFVEPKAALERVSYKETRDVLSKLF